MVGRRTIAALVFVMVCFNGALPARAQDTQPASPDLLAVVRRARALLQQEVDHERADPQREPVVVGSRNVHLRVKLALWNEHDDSITLVRLTKGEGSVLTVEHPTYAVHLKRDNGVNSEFTVTGHPELHVMALKHPVFVDISTGKKSRWRLDNVVYTPYSSFLETPAIVSAGEAYLDSQVRAAYTELRELGVTSLAFPKQLLADAIDPLVVESIIAIEHVSPSVLISGSVADYLAAFAVVLATNERSAYAYARSSASARGLAQFIPSTYARLVRARPKLKLEPSFERGTTDPVNAIKAEVALLDSNITALPPEARIRYETEARNLGALLAAMYNGGSTRPRRALAHWGDAWAEDHTVSLATTKATEKAALAEVKRLQRLLAAKGVTAAERAKYKQGLAAAKKQAAEAEAAYAAGTRANLRRETVLYVAKFYRLYDHLAKQEAAAAAARAEPMVADERELGGADPVQTNDNMVR